MSNTDFPNGFLPSRHIKGGIIRASQYLIPSGYAANIFSGDLVEMVTAGTIELSAVTGVANVGIFAGVEWTAADGEYKFSRYWPTGTVTKGSVAAKAYVYDDPGIAYRVQTGGTTAFAQTLVGTYCDTLAEHSGSTATGQSAEELNIATAGDATAQWRVLGLLPEPGNEMAASAKVEVMLVETLLTPPSVIGIGT